MPIRYLQSKEKQQGWGKQIRTNQFRIYAIPVFQPNVALDMTGHQILNVAYTEDTGVPTTEVEWQQGGMIEIEEAETTKIKAATATMKFPQALWTFLDGILEFTRNANCWVLLRVPECVDPCEQRFTFYAAIFGQQREIGTFVGFTDNKQVVDREAPVTFPKFFEQWILNKVAVITGFEPLHGVSFVVQGCPGGCSCDPLRTVYAVGSDGITPVLYTSEDALGSLITATAVPLTGFMAGTDDPTELWVDENIIIIPYANDPSPLTATTGGIIWSLDNVTFNDGVDSAGAALTDPFFWVDFANGRWIALGGGGAIYESFNGRTWFPIPHSLGISPVFVHGVYDSKTTTVYVAGFNGAAGVALEIAGDSLITDISADVNPPGRLFSVHKLGDDHIAFGGEFGFLTESFKASERVYSGNEFAPLVTDIVYAIGGNSFYTIFAINNDFYHRNIFTKMDIAAMTLTNVVITGDIQDIAVAYHPEQGYIKRIVAVTNDGEVIRFDDCLPDLCDYLRTEGNTIPVT